MSKKAELIALIDEYDIDAITMFDLIVGIEALMQSFAEEQVNKALKEVLKSLPNDMDAYADDCINEAITKALNQQDNE